MVAKRHKFSEQTIYNWRKRLGALAIDEMRRLSSLRPSSPSLAAPRPRAKRDLTPPCDILQPASLESRE